MNLSPHLDYTLLEGKDHGFNFLSTIQRMKSAMHIEKAQYLHKKNIFST